MIRNNNEVAGMAVPSASDSKPKKDKGNYRAIGLKFDLDKAEDVACFLILNTMKRNQVDFVTHLVKQFIRKHNIDVMNVTKKDILASMQYESRNQSDELPYTVNELLGLIPQKREPKNKTTVSNVGGQAITAAEPVNNSSIEAESITDALLALKTDTGTESITFNEDDFDDESVGIDDAMLADMERLF